MQVKLVENGATRSHPTLKAQPLREAVVDDREEGLRIHETVSPGFVKLCCRPESQHLVWIRTQGTIDQVLRFTGPVISNQKCCTNGKGLGRRQG